LNSRCSEYDCSETDVCSPSSFLAEHARGPESLEDKPESVGSMNVFTLLALPFADDATGISGFLSRKGSGLLPDLP